MPISGGAGLDHVIKEQVLAQNILGEIVFHFPPNRVDVVCPVLPVVELDDEVAAVYSVVMLLVLYRGTGPSEVKIVYAFLFYSRHSVLGDVGADLVNVLAD